MTLLNFGKTTIQQEIYFVNTPWSYNLGTVDRKFPKRLYNHNFVATLD